MRRLAILLLLIACSRHRERQDVTLTSATVDAQVPDLTQMALQWNRAVSERDPNLVSLSYGDEVSFYGVPLRHDQLVSILTAAFDADQSFTQTITDVRPQGSRVDFRRTWIRFGTKQEDHAWLVGASENGRWVVTSQGDDAFDVRERTRPDAKISSCEDLAMRVARSTPEASALIEGPPGNVRARVAATPPSFPGFAIAMTTVAANQPTTVGFYDVVSCHLYSPAPNLVPMSGACVTPGNAPGAITDMLSGRILAADPELVLQMSRCKD